MTFLGPDAPPDTPTRRALKAARRNAREHRRSLVATLLLSHRTFRQMQADLAALDPPIHASLSTLAKDADVIRGRWLERAQLDYDALVGEQMAVLDALMGAHLGRAMAGNVKSTERVMSILDRMAKLQGLDRPQRFEFSGPGGGPIPVDTRSPDQLRSRLMAVIDRVTGQDAPCDVPDAELVPDTDRPGGGDTGALRAIEAGAA